MADEATAAAAAPANGRRKLPMIVGGVVVLALIAGVWMWLSSGKESTDDAQVEGHITQLATRVGGTVVKVLVTDNQYVEAGTVVAEIDPRDYQVAVDRARAELADAEATATAAGTGVPIAEVSTRSDVSQASGGVEETQAGIAVADSQVEAAKAELVAVQARQREREATATKNAKDVERLKPLVAKEEIAQQQFDAAVAAADAARAAADAARSDIASAQTAIAVAQQRAVQARAGAAQARATLQTARTAPQQIQATRARHASAEAKVQQMRAALAQAELNLERTTIKAPTAGVVSRKTVEVGAVVQPGQPLMALVSLADVWVVANFKETQLAEMRDGQKVSIEVDALDGRTFSGHIDSLSAATGARFSLLPPENATGNYVKVVQRVPVKIVLDPGQDPDHRLRPGMSVFPTVHLK
jgi:membrane fusion protein (multidrug efflux system)